MKIHIKKWAEAHFDPPPSPLGFYWGLLDYQDKAEAKLMNKKPSEVWYAAIKRTSKRPSEVWYGVPETEWHMGDGMKVAILTAAATSISWALALWVF